MPNKMLIDASHPEETRVVVTRGNRIEEFDFESQDKKQLRGNIYLARVTRVEPSLQAAFVEYGGNRHGFLAFSEIHPDYYQIPVADRQALLQAEADAAQEEDDDNEEEERSSRRRRRSRSGKNRNADDERKSASEDGSSDANPDDLADIEPFETTSFLSGGFASPGGDSTSDASETEHEEDAATLVAVVTNEQEASDSEADTVAQSDEGNDLEEDDQSKSGRTMPADIDGDVVSESIEDVAGAEDTAPEGVSHSDSDELSEDNGDDSDDEVESVGAEDAIEEAQPRRRAPRKQYKIQEVIKRRQILLVQVVKEERGNKGAALTTYLSLAGRYSVLMPNTARGGGISRKITNVQDRKRLKEVVKELEVPQGMGVILRTAGESRTKAEIRRDYEYLMRLWENVRTLTLQSTAPALVYEEGSLIKRSVRDLYNKDIGEIQVAGEEGYREAKDFMRMLMPSHAKVVQPYRDTVPIFARNGIEAQLDRMLQPQVNLKSGGYIIINQTEALVAIDVNSGRSTKEHSIEDTALQTNLEAADEVARQLRLRDLAGLIVVDFIDMEENRNNRAVEKRMKDALKNDRARIQVGRISHFGLLEMSRQRIRASVLESTTQTCPHCGGTGHVRSESSVGLHVIRAIEEYLLKDNRNNITVRTPVSTALYVLNHKRSTLTEIEQRFGVAVSLEADETLGTQHYAISKGTPVENPVVIPTPTFEDVAEEFDDEVMEPFDGENSEEGVTEIVEQSASSDKPESERDSDRKRRRRRRRRGRDQERVSVAGSSEDSGSNDGTASEGGPEEEAAGDEVGEIASEELAVATDAKSDSDESEQKKRRRGKRGGRRNRREDEGEVSESENGAADQVAVADDVIETVLIEPEDGGAAPAPQLEPDASLADEQLKSHAPQADALDAVAASDAAAQEEPVKPKRPRARRVKKVSESAADAEVNASSTAETVSGTDASVSPASSETGDTVAPGKNDLEAAAPVAEKKPARRSRRRVTETETETVQAPIVTSLADEPKTEEAPKPRRSGWWQRKG